MSHRAIRRSVVIASAIVLASVAPALAQADIEPARFSDGSIPQRVSPLAAGGGDVMLSVAVSASGAVGAVDVLRSTPPYTDAVVHAVRTWRFSPALDSKRKPMDTHVLVGAVVGVPAVEAPARGTQPRDVSTADTRVPFPAQTFSAPYPVNARGEGTVLVEARVDASGHVVGVTAVRSFPPFDTIALDAARAMTFRPAQDAAAPPSTLAYLLFVFRQPVTGGVGLTTPAKTP
jgi:TonB family protein